MTTGESFSDDYHDTEPTIKSFLQDLPLAEGVWEHDSLAKVVTLMLRNGYTQLTVHAGKEDRSAVTGIVTWIEVMQALLALVTRQQGEGSPLAVKVKDLNPRRAAKVKQTQRLHTAVAKVMAKDALVVEAERNRACRILTAQDLLAGYHDAVEPYLQVESVERSIRALAQKCVRPEVLAGCLERMGDGRRMAADRAEQLASKTDPLEYMTLGEVATLFEDEQLWIASNLFSDQKAFTNLLKDATKARNRQMHFRFSRSQKASPERRKDMKILEATRLMLKNELRVQELRDNG